MWPARSERSIAIGPATAAAAATRPRGIDASIAAEDGAGPSVMLCSDLAGHITGEIVNVNGGAVLAG